jgi:hypothetical protein
LVIGLGLKNKKNKSAMQIYINKNGQQLGPFDEANVAEMLQNGKLLLTDLAIREGESEWQALSKLLPNTDLSGDDFVPDFGRKHQSKSGCLPNMLIGFGAICLSLGLIFGGIGLTATQHDECSLYAKYNAASEKVFEELGDLKDFPLTKIDELSKTDRAKIEKYEEARKIADTYLKPCMVRKGEDRFRTIISIPFLFVGILSLIFGMKMRAKN